MPLTVLVLAALLQASAPSSPAAAPQSDNDRLRACLALVRSNPAQAASDAQAWVDEHGRLKPGYEICLRNNENGSFANIHADKLGLFKGKISKNIQPYDCEF